MKKLIRQLLEFWSSEMDFSRLGNQGAIILDVRSEMEYVAGHIRGSINIPADNLDHHINKLKSLNTPIVICCATGTISKRAKKMLKSSGFCKVYYGGAWKRLANKVY